MPFLHMYTHILLHYGQAGTKYNTKDSYALVERSKWTYLKRLILSARGKCKPALCVRVYMVGWLGHYTCIKKNRGPFQTLPHIIMFLGKWDPVPGKLMLLKDQKWKVEIYIVLVRHAGWWVIRRVEHWLQRRISLLENKYIVEEFKDRKRMNI